MGSTRSWAADMEDEIKTCRHGVQSKYFNECRCEGCKLDRARVEANRLKAESIRYAAMDYFDRSSPEEVESRFTLVMKLLETKS